MIYIKIYLDRDENGEDILVFDSVKNEDDHSYFRIAGIKHKTFPMEYDHFETMTSVIGVEQVAISPEAKAFFLTFLTDENALNKVWYGADITIKGCHWGQYGWNSGVFAFRPSDIQSGNTVRILRCGDTLAVKHGVSPHVLDYMTPGDNEMIKALALIRPADEAPLLDAYYGAMHARGETPACDADTIGKTPLRYMTKAQKDLIRRDYRAMVNRYDSQEWHDHGDFLQDQIEWKLAETYLKFHNELDIILHTQD